MQHPIEPAPPLRRDEGLDPHRLANIVKSDCEAHPDRYGDGPISVIRVFFGTAVVIPDILVKKDADAWIGSVVMLNEGIDRIPAGHTILLAGPAIEVISDVPLPCLDKFFRDEVGVKSSGVVSTVAKACFDGWISGEAPIQRPKRSVIRRKAGYRLRTQRPWHELPVLQKHFLAKAAGHPDSRFAHLAMPWTPGKPHGYDIDALLSALRARFKDDPDTWFLTTFSE